MNNLELNYNVMHVQHSPTYEWVKHKYYGAEAPQKPQIVHVTVVITVHLSSSWFENREQLEGLVNRLHHLSC